MMNLMCVIVGMPRSTFGVDIDEGASVAKLKEKIKELFLAKKGKQWLTQFEALEGVTDTSDYKCLPPFPTAKLRAVGLANGQLGVVGRAERAAGKGHVHVLVVPPMLLRIGVDKQHVDKIVSYMKIADRLKDTEEVKSLSRYLTNAKKEQGAPLPFVVLENSSGTGKTQMAFNLQARGECEVFYIVCEKAGDRVYNAYARRSAAFLSCVNRDLETMEREEFFYREQLSTLNDFRRDTSFALYGFILAALRGSDVVLITGSRSDVTAELARRKERGAKPFVFFLDDFPRVPRTNLDLNDEDQLKRENTLRTMRNVFRSFDLTVVLSSSNGTARKLHVTSNCSRGGGPYLWCVAYPSLPRVDFNDYSGIPALLMEIIKHSRPLFAEIALQYVQDNPYTGGGLIDYLNAMAGTLAIRFGKRKKRTDEFEIGQLCLLLCSSCRVEDDKVNIIDGHFARLPEQSAFELYLGPNGLCKANGPGHVVLFYLPQRKTCYCT